MLPERRGMPARQERCRKDDMSSGLFERDRSRMLATLGVAFNPARWKIGHADDLEIVTVDGGAPSSATAYPCT